MNGIQKFFQEVGETIAAPDDHWKSNPSWAEITGIALVALSLGTFWAGCKLYRYCFSATSPDPVQAQKVSEVVRRTVYFKTAEIVQRNTGSIKYKILLQCHCGGLDKKTSDDKKTPADVWDGFIDQMKTNGVKNDELAKAFQEVCNSYSWLKDEAYFGGNQKIQELLERRIEDVSTVAETSAEIITGIVEDTNLPMYDKIQILLHKVGGGWEEFWGMIQTSKQEDEAKYLIALLSKDDREKLKGQVKNCEYMVQMLNSLVDDSHRGKFLAPKIAKDTQFSLEARVRMQVYNMEDSQTDTWLLFKHGLSTEEVNCLRTILQSIRVQGKQFESFKKDLGV